MEAGQLSIESRKCKVLVGLHRLQRKLTFEELFVLAFFGPIHALLSFNISRIAKELLDC